MQLRTLFFLQIDEHWAKWFVPLALSVCMFVSALRRGGRDRERRGRQGAEGERRGERGEEERQEERGGRREWGEEEREGGGG